MRPKRKELIKSILFFFCLVFTLSPIYSESIQEKKKLSLLLYGGKYTETDLLPILFSQKTDYKNSYIGVIGLNYALDYKIRFLEFETEVLLGKHFGIMNHWETDIFTLARISNLFYLPMSFAFGEGLSFASQNPSLENKQKGFYLETGLYQFNSIRSRNLLNYVMVELDYRIWDTIYQPRIFIRVHHRSGVFGLFCPPDPACGSNFVTYGVKFSF